MLKNWKSTLGIIAISVSMFAAGAAFTPAAHAQAYPMQRPNGSDRSLWNVDNRLAGLIDQLQRDQRDYDGHRVAAISDMQQARGQLQAALQYDRAHGH